MFIGEFVCFGLLGIKRLIYRDKTTTVAADAVPLSPGMKKAEEKKKLTKINPLLLAIPATCDFMGSSLMFVALTMVPAAVYQMMRGIIVVITALLAVIFLGRKQYRHHWTSLAIIVLGVFQVGYVSVLYSKNHPDGSASTTGGSELMGIILLLISQCFSGVQFIVEEKLLNDYYLDPFLIVGTEGMWGIAYYMAVLPFMQLKTCGYGGGALAGMCNFGYLENSAYGFQQMVDNKILILQTAGSICSIAAFNSFGIATTKYASAAQRSTIDTSRTVVIWVLSCLLMGAPWEPWSIIGFVMLACGTLVYNEILIVPIFGFDQWTKAAINARAGKNEDGSAKENYTSLSPHAAYDANRNMRALRADESDTPMGVPVGYPLSQTKQAEEDEKAEYMLNTRDGDSFTK